MEFQVNIQGLYIDRQIGEPVIVLKEKNGTRTVPIWIRMNEMFPLALSMAGEKYRPQRPLAHDLIKTIVHNLHAQVRQAVIVDIKDHIYTARLHLSSPQTQLTLDARPSDAILLALKFEAPIFVEDQVAQKQTQLAEIAGQTPESLLNRLQAFRPEDFIDSSIG